MPHIIRFFPAQGKREARMQAHVFGFVPGERSAILICGY